MVLEESTLQIAYVVSIGTSIALCGVVWRHREKTGAIPLFCYVLSGLFWGGNQLANLLIDDPVVSAALYRFLYVGIAVGTASLFVFAFEYTDRERYLGPKTYLALSIHPLYVLAAAVADPGGLFFGTIEPDSAVMIGVTAEHGIGLAVHLLYSYALVVASILMFVDLLYRSRSLYRGQSVALLGGAVLPAVPPLLLVFGVVEYDASPIAIPIASALFTVAIVRYRLIDLVPIARDRVVDTVNDGVFVVDNDERLIDVNPEGRRILRAIGNDPDESLIGREFTSLLPETEIRDEYERIAERGEETTLETSIGDNHFQVTATPIDDGRDRQVGWLAIAHDVTERERRENELERQNERLEEFASIVSHDLRNPLTVADGYLELAREADDPDHDLDRHLEAIDRAHDRMETIIDDVLTLAREGTAVTDPEPVDIEVIARRAWNGVETDGAALEVRSSGTIRADPERFRRLLENLFRNSVEHGSTGSRPQADDSVEHGSTSPDSQARQDDGRRGASPEDSVEHGLDEPPTAAEPTLTVAVGLSRDGGARGPTLYVEDDGPGIPSDQRDRVFEAGYTTAEDGTGFGLRIVRQIAEAHGWSVAVTEGTAGGARFEFTGVEAGSDSSDAATAGSVTQSSVR